MILEELDSINWEKKITKFKDASFLLQKKDPC